MVRGGEWLAAYSGLSRNTLTSVYKELEDAGRVIVRRKPHTAHLFELLPYQPIGLPEGGRGGR
jgi:hypothetical protein